jgi:hypothetical protein
MVMSSHLGFVVGVPAEAHMEMSAAQAAEVALA